MGTNLAIKDIGVKEELVMDKKPCINASVAYGSTQWHFLQIMFGRGIQKR